MNAHPHSDVDPAMMRATPRGSVPGRAALAVATVGLLLTGCAAGSEAAPSASVQEAAVEAQPVTAVGEIEGAEFDETSNDIELFDSSVVHSIVIDFDQADYDAMIDTFVATGDKEWIAATVTIDGETYDDVGLRLKGNSSLFGLTSATAGDPQELPWLIRLNEFVDGADHQGVEEIVIRSNSTETALNEAVAQELLAITGLASQRPIATAFTVNGGETVLRLAVEHPDEEWYEDHFADEDGLLYKADSEGDYSYRGDDPEAYADVFDQKVGDDDLEPLIDFLDFINNTDDATFADHLGDHLDVEAFATYLAFQDLVGNADDINGRGNNSYLQYDTTTNRFTVVSWDLNLAFDTANVTGAGGAGGGGRAAGGGGRPAGPPPDATDAAAAAGAARGAGPGDQPNVLVDRFLADDGFADQYAAATAELTELLFTNGTVDEVIANWADVLMSGAADLVADDVIAAEAAAIVAYVDGVR